MVASPCHMGSELSGKGISPASAAVQRSERASPVPRRIDLNKFLDIGVPALLPKGSLARDVPRHTQEFHRAARGILIRRDSNRFSGWVGTVLWCKLFSGAEE